ncbi:MAG TPA: cyclic nucleotide-binding domain-containing protein, partial [Thermoanaerobaculia bacterium]
MALSVEPRDDQLFPTLTPAQIDRVAAHGRRRHAAAGGVLVQAGQAEHPVFVVLAGEVEVVRATREGERVVATHRQGQFSGEINALAGRPALATIRAGKESDVVELRRDALLALVQDDAELSEILMRAFILRRALLLDQGLGDVLVLGSEFSPRTIEIRDFLA